MGLELAHQPQIVVGDLYFVDGLVGSQEVRGVAVENLLGVAG